MRYKGDMTDRITTVPLDRRTSLYSILGFWAGYFLLNTLRWAVLGSPDLAGAIGRRSVVTLFGIGFTYLLYLLLRRFERSPMSTLVTVAFIAAVPVSLAYAAVNYSAFYVVNPLESTLQELAHSEKHFGPVTQICETAIEWYFFIASWASQAPRAE